MTRISNGRLHCSGVRRRYRGQGLTASTQGRDELVDSLLDGVLREVPLTYGRYDRSAWWSAVGIEQFRPLPGSTPTEGRAGQVERVPTVRLEFVIPHDPDLLERVLNRGLIANHPWEEPAVLVSTTHTTANLDKLGHIGPRADRG